MELKTPGLIKKYRKNAKLSQTTLAKLMGVSPGAVAHWERGERLMSVRHAEKFAKTINCDTKEVMETLFLDKLEVTLEQWGNEYEDYDIIQGHIDTKIKKCVETIRDNVKQHKLDENKKTM